MKETYKRGAHPQLRDIPAESRGELKSYKLSDTISQEASFYLLLYRVAI